MWIKICANTNLEDAKLAADLGADAVGFVFAPSKRQVTAEQVAAITSHLPESVEKIGVFSSQDAAEIVRIVRTGGLTGVQLHGGFDVELARRLKADPGDGIVVIQTLHWQVDGDASNVTEIAAQLEIIAKEPAIDRVLIDSKIGQAIGGTGQIFDWNAARSVFEGAEAKLILAGGLRPENVAEAIRVLKPWGVDVASGVEASAGRKDPAQIKQFIQRTKNLNSELLP